MRFASGTAVSLSARRPPSLEVVAEAAIEEVDWVLRPGPLQQRQTALHVRLDQPAEACGVGIEGTIPVSVSIERYDEVVSLCCDLHEAVTEACSDLRGANLEPLNTVAPGAT
jgi:hypothetical protein